MGEIFGKLGITLQGMLFHIIALAVLVAVMVFLLYKPMKKIISDHNKHLNDVFSENDKLNAEALDMKNKYEGMVADVKQEAVRVSAEAAEKAQVRADEIVSQAEKSAQNILLSAKEESKASKERLSNEFKTAVSKMAVDIAGKVLEREISEKDNKDIIDACLTEWEK